ncbi:HAD family hydrolase [Citricoccus sp. NR2]|uniref:HAD family hydrolase n=1 Tax=Citricoccus sp. NR2 TaxID=3004095 RepID=UPI0022DE90F3|nr:HAD family hydrolase [Citricoccus sp. NR2]WBL19801.1 HAD family hydrolase [Citricoccus sp. NR2]
MNPQRPRPSSRASSSIAGAPTTGLSPHGAHLERSAAGHPVVRPSLIATDLDGTVISYRHTRTGHISQRTIEAFTAAREAGIQVVFVTGRPMRWLSGLADTLGQAGPIICSNGAVIYDVVADKVIEAHPMAGETVRTVHELISASVPHTSFGLETLSGFVMETELYESSRRSRRQHPESPDDDTAAPEFTLADPVISALGEHPEVVKFLVKAAEVQPDSFLATVRGLVGELVSVTHSAPGLPLLEISRPDVNKALTLADYTNSLGVAAEEVAAFGDMLNDLEMITWAGTGYAVASAHPQLIDAADAVAGACDDDGVARAIEHLITLPT